MWTGGVVAMASTSRRGPGLVGRDELAWRTREDAELDNLRAAATWALDRDDPDDVACFLLASSMRKEAHRPGLSTSNRTGALTALTLKEVAVMISHRRGAGGAKIRQARCAHEPRADRARAAFGSAEHVVPAFGHQADDPE